MKFPPRQPKTAKKAVAPATKLGRQRNEYYENISAGLGIVQVVLYLSLFAFVVISFLTNSNLITYQNFYHFFQDLNASAERVDIFSHDSLSYSTDEEFATIHGDDEHIGIENIGQCVVFYKDLASRF